MRLAQRVGMPIPEIAVRYVPEPIYLVRRFDREGEWPDVRRRHMLDACQLLSLDRAFKYQQSMPSTLAQLVEICREKALTRQRLFRWAVFNALIGNGDAHLKNLSFFVDSKGIQLAPHYDLVSTTNYADPGKWGDSELSLPMGDARFFRELRRHHVLDFGKVIGIPSSVANRLLEEMLNRLVAAASMEVGQFETGLSPVVGPGEQRQLRLIVGGVLRDMRDQLA